MAIIYGLIDPGKEHCATNVRYVGKAERPLERLYGHVRRAKSGNILPLYQWIRSIGCPEMFILEECDEEEWQARESFWIKELRNTNELFNIAPGGNGFGKMSDEKRKYMSQIYTGRVMDRAIVEKIRASNTGKRRTIEQRLRMSVAQTGRTVSKEHREKIAATLKGVKHSDERKRNTGDACRGEKNGFYGKKHTEEAKAKMSVSRKAFFSKRYAEKLPTVD